MADTQQITSPGSFFALWRAAWRALPDNPLYQYSQLASRRQYERVPPKKRILGYIVLLVVALGLIVAVISILAPTTSSLDQVLLPAFMLLSGLLYLTWLANGIAIAVRDGLGLLSAAGKRSVGLQIDDMLSITRLSSRDIVLAAVMNSCHVLQPRVLGGAIVVVLDIFAGVWLNGNSDMDGLLGALLLSPVTVACLFLSGSLAVLVCTLGLIAAGRGLNADRLASLSALLLLLGNIVWIGVAFGFMADSAVVNGDHYTDSLVQILGPSLVLLSMYALLGLAQWKSGLRVIYAAAGPALLPLILFLGAMSYEALQAYLDLVNKTAGYDWGVADNIMGSLAAFYMRAWGAFAIINPLAVPHAWCWGSYNQDPAPPGDLWLNLVLTVALQLGLLAILSQFALRAVELRRQNA